MWQKGVDLAELIYRVTAAFPKEERYGLSAQLRRAAVSISSNIAEGYRRRTTGDFSYFLRVALGSTSEMETQIIIAARVAFLNNEEKDSLLQRSQEVSRLLYSLMMRVGSKRGTENSK